MMNLAAFLIFISTNLLRTIVNIRFLEVFLEKIKEKQYLYVQFGSMVLCFFITSIGYLAFHTREINIFANIVGIFILTLAFIGSFRKKLFIVLIVYFVNMICDVIVVTSFYDYTLRTEVYEFLGTMTVLLITVCEIVVEKIVYIRKIENFVSPYWALLLLIPLCSMVMIHFSIYNSFSKHNTVVVIEGVGLLVINIVSFYLFSAMEIAYSKNIENELAVQTSKIYKNQLDIIIKSQEQIHSFRYDMKYHVRELLSMAKSKNMEDMIEYLENMNLGTENPDEYVYSGNREFDSNLNYLLQRANDKLENVLLKVKIPEQSLISAFDINIILSNLLDNAITAAEKSDEKYLNIDINANASLLYISIENSYNGIVKEHQGTFFTLKEDKQLHGYGLKNVKRIVKKYNGTMNTTYSESRFCTNIMLYLTNMID